MITKVVQNGCRFPQARELLKDGVDGRLHLLIRIERHPAIGLADIADRQRTGQLALAGLVPAPALQASSNGPQFGFAEGALESQEQAIIMILGIVETVFVGNQGVENRGRLQNPVPVALGTGKGEISSAKTRPTWPRPKALTSC